MNKSEIFYHAQLAQSHLNGSLYYDDGDKEIMEAFIAAAELLKRAETSVKIPTSVDEAKLMVSVGMKYLQENAPEELIVNKAKEDCKHDYARYSGEKFMHCAQCKVEMSNEPYWNASGYDTKGKMR